MSHRLRVLVALLEDPVSVPSTSVGQFTTPVTPASEDPTFSLPSVDKHTRSCIYIVKTNEFQASHPCLKHSGDVLALPWSSSPCVPWLTF